MLDFWGLLSDLAEMKLINLPVFVKELKKSSLSKCQAAQCYRLRDYSKKICHAWQQDPATRHTYQFPQSHIAAAPDSFVINPRQQHNSRMT